ncbi:TrbI/VirB10 family protein [Enterovibrio paralichthyis]|uniref:TrbI/VirB10 family protein n=1 Tax=Enterovibrio paralichthyis TaxID=2853805 RepID=UPI001C4639E4|nr:TrbI/VirB10 family protein [Enterovibrio paralichthyis]MBV7300745.1 TrbI/VirB10 family protein [Enterovibrio paralichthyis]
MDFTLQASGAKIALAVLGGAVFTGAVIGGVVLIANAREAAPTKEMAVVNGHVPVDYMTLPRDDIFLLSSERDEFDSGESSEPALGTLSPYTEQSQTESYAMGQYQAPKAPPPQRTSTDTLTPANTFVYPAAPSQAELIAMRRAQINAKRRGSPDWKHPENMPVIVAKRERLPAPKDKDFSAHELDKDETTYPVDLDRVITSDRYIDCVLKDQINSQLEGRATCQIERNVYGYHGRKILIPAGSVAVGKHGTLKKVGDERFNIAWSRIIRPDGVNIKLTDGYTADRIGATGIEGIVDNRNWDKYGGALLTSTISAIAQVSVPTEGTTVTNSVIQSYGTDIGQVTAAMLNEGLNIKPFSIVPAGTRIKIIPTTDIWLKDIGKTGGLFAPTKE